MTAPAVLLLIFFFRRPHIGVRRQTFESFLKTLGTFLRCQIMTVVFRPMNSLKCPLCEVVKTRASWRSRRCITNSVAAADTVCSQWDDQRAEKAIKGVCPSISGRLNTKNDLSLRWTGRLTDPPLFITWLLSYFLDDWTVSPLSREPNTQLLKE